MRGEVARGHRGKICKKRFVAQAIFRHGTEWRHLAAFMTIPVPENVHFGCASTTLYNTTLSNITESSRDSNEENWRQKMQRRNVVMNSFAEHDNQLNKKSVIVGAMVINLRLLLVAGHVSTS